MNASYQHAICTMSLEHVHVNCLCGEALPSPNSTTRKMFNPGDGPRSPFKRLRHKAASPQRLKLSSALTTFPFSPVLSHLLVGSFVSHKTLIIQIHRYRPFELIIGRPRAKMAVYTSSWTPFRGTQFLHLEFPFLVAVLLVILNVASPVKGVLTNCYDPDGGLRGDTPCNPDSSGSACCANGWGEFFQSSIHDV